MHLLRIYSGIAKDESYGAGGCTRAVCHEQGGNVQIFHEVANLSVVIMWPVSSSKQSPNTLRVICRPVFFILDLALLLISKPQLACFAFRDNRPSKFNLIKKYILKW